MIVKNESEIIGETLEKLIKKIKIDYYVISDTGSSDNTVEIIQNVFKNNNIEGEIFHDEWKNFEYNRTKALEYAFGKTDYLLIFDADDEICGNLVLPENLNHDCYNLMIKCGSLTFERPLLINNKLKWKFESVVHEYLVCCEPTYSRFTITGDYYVAGNTKGARSKNPNKYLLDAVTLEKAYLEVQNTPKQHLMSRYAFYCGNSYFDFGEVERAIEWYNKRLTLDGYEQEKYYSCLKLAQAYLKLEDKETSTYYYVKSYRYDKDRVEGIYEVIKQYIIDGENDIAYQYYMFIKDSYEKNYENFNTFNKLFMNLSINNFYLPYYMIILCERMKKYDLGLLMYKIIFKKKQNEISEWWIKNLLFNLRFFIDKTEDTEFFNLLKDYLKFLIVSGIDIKKYEFDYLKFSKKN
jgi:tetratricopeptide (TPR) repeat protein